MKMHLIYSDKDHEDIIKFKRATSSDQAYRALDEILCFTGKECRNKNDQWNDDQWTAIDFLHSSIYEIMERCSIDMDLFYE